MLRVGFDKIFDQKPTQAQGQLKRPACQLCKGGGYLLPANLAEPSPCTPAALVAIALPCGCPAGDEFRALAAEISKPIKHREGRTLRPGTEVPWL